MRRLRTRSSSRGWVQANKRIFNNTKISDHFAIIPTGTPPKSLTEAEQKIYDLVTRRFLAVFFPAAEYQITTRITRVEGEAFKTGEGVGESRLALRCMARRPRATTRMAARN